MTLLKTRKYLQFLRADEIRGRREREDEREKREIMERGQGDE